MINQLVSIHTITSNDLLNTIDIKLKIILKTFQMLLHNFIPSASFLYKRKTKKRTSGRGWVLQILIQFK